MAKIPSYQIRLEFELYHPEPGYDPFNDCFMMGVTMEDGTHYGLTVCTFRFLETYRKEQFGRSNELVGKYCISPDLLVEKAERRLLEQVVADLVASGKMKPAWIETTDDEPDAPAEGGLR